MTRYSFINTLSESRMFPSEDSLNKISDEKIKEMLYLHLIFLSVGSANETIQSQVRHFASKASAFGNYDHFRTSGNDLYSLAYAASKTASLYALTSFMKKIATGINSIAEDSKLLLKYEELLKIQSGPLKQLRRDMTIKSNEELLEKIGKFIKSYDARAEILDIISSAVGKSKELTTTQKVALGVGIAVAGYHMGKFATHDPTLDKYRK